MCDMEQHGKGNTARLPWMHGVLPVVAAVSLLLAAQPWLLGQSPDTLPNAPSALLFSASVSANANTLPAEEQSAPQNAMQNAPPDPAQSAPKNPAQNAQPLPSTTITLDTLIPLVNPPTFGQSAPSGHATYVSLPPCPKRAPKEFLPLVLQPATQPTCQDQLQLIVDTGYVKPISSEKKGILAVRAVTDPFNLLAIGFFSGITIAANAHSVYGPGFAGWGRLSGYTLAEDIQTEFTGVYLIPSLVHEDPRYHRMPGAPVGRRIKHALIHTLVSQHDDGSLMPNYATLINYPLTAEISNLYVPGEATYGRATARRIFVGYATDPIDPLIAEFLPDVAKRFHVHTIFMQRILNHIAPGSGGEASP
jgi:hypothetical protein